MAAIVTRSIAGFFSLTLGIGLATPPADWIERLGFDLDRGSGMIESLLSVLAIAVGVGLVAGSIVSKRYVVRQQ